MKKRTLTTLLVLLVLVCIPTFTAYAQGLNIRFLSFYDEYIQLLGSKFSVIKNISYKYTFTSEEGKKTCISFGVFLDYGNMGTLVDTDYSVFVFGNRSENACTKIVPNGQSFPVQEILTAAEDGGFSKAIYDAYFNGTDQELLEAFNQFVEYKTGISFLPDPTATPLPTDTPLPTFTNTPLPTDTPLPTFTNTPLPTDTPLPTATREPLVVPAVVQPVDPPDQEPPHPVMAMSPDNVVVYFALGMVLLLVVIAALFLRMPTKKGGGASHA